MRYCAAVVLTLAIGLVTLGSAADDDDHDRARALREDDRVLPLAEILERIAEKVPGRLLEAEFEEEHGRYVYELEILGPDGAVHEVLVDAASGVLLSRELED